MKKRQTGPAARPTSRRNAAPRTPAASLVAIGASAGGLQALLEFLAAAQALPQTSFVVVQHLSADQPSMLPELLRRGTALPVLKIDDGMPIRPASVYVAPPGYEVHMARGKLRLVELLDKPAPHLPIDAFLGSIPGNFAGEAIGVVLSGMGSDGTQGLRALREAGGAGFIQTPESAQFDSMPRSALRAELGDVVAPPAELPALIADYLDHLYHASSAPDPRQPTPPGDADDDPPLAAAPDRPSSETELRALDAILAVLRARTGHDFTSYKKSTLRRRVERRMAIYHALTFHAYGTVLAENPGEVDLLFKEMLIGVTSFFRDPEVWAHLLDDALPDMLARRPEGGLLRLWVPGCSTGEEVYSLAMVLTDALQTVKPSARPDFKIFATDIDGDAIDLARAAKYPDSIVETVSPDRLARFFVRDESGYRIRKEVREKVIFAVQNVAMDPPFTKLDMLVCRNLLIYFEPALQRLLFPLFHYSLEPGGLLLLGTAETAGPTTEFFAPLPGKFKLYRRVENYRRGHAVNFSATTVDRRMPPKPPDPDLPEGADGMRMHTLVDSLLLQRYAPAAVLVTRDGDVLYVSGKTGRYLEPAAGRANWNIFAMAREGLVRPLGLAFKEAIREQRSVTTLGVVLDPPYGARHFKVTIDPHASTSALLGTMLVVFNDVDVPMLMLDEVAEPGALAPPPAEPPAPAPRTHDREVQRLRAALRSALDEAQNADEQVRAANEELQSTNEELQSTNEELTTSKEELQSMNEELQTVNQELQAKVDELSQASDDMRNLLNSTEIATIFLDEALRIRRYTAQCAAVFKLIPSDTGRPITDIANDLKGWSVSADANEVLSSLVPKESEIAAMGNRWFRVRMMPYRTSSNRIDGVVITFAETSTSKRLERELTRAKSVLEGKLKRRGPRG